jgi:2-phospho-L-lactate guanylyltransferase
VLIPVKRLVLAKSRLGAPYAHHRQALALAFAQDTLVAALQAEQVAAVVVVTDDALVADACRTAGADVLADAPGAGLNAALRHGAEHVRRAQPSSRVAALSGDLPALRPGELDAALEAATAFPAALVCDVSGVGTTLLTAMQGTELDPRFGPRSREAHRAAGAVELDGALVSLRRDVDTVADLLEARQLGTGPATTRVLAELDGG